MYTNLHAGLPDGKYIYLHTKNPNWGIFWRALEWKIFVGIFYSDLE
jgi:hypothetical protein